MSNDNDLTTNRRDFIKATAAGIAVVSATHVSVARAEDKIAPAERDVTNRVDVLVVGGGTAGTIAAIQAGRAGAKILLLERHSQLGGMTTTGGVSRPVTHVVSMKNGKSAMWS